MQGQMADILSVLFHDLSHQCQSNFSGRVQVSAKGQFVIRESDYVYCVKEHNPVIPSKLANLTDVSSPPFHDGFWDLPAHGIDVICGVRANQALGLNAVVPKAFRGTSSDHFVGNPMLELANAALGCLLLGGILLCHAHMTIHLIQFMPEDFFDLLLGAV